jgi:hypothetical protein
LVIVNNVDGNLSEWATVHSRIPQQSVLGSILIVILINDLPAKIFSEVTKILNVIKIYSEDTKILKFKEDIYSKELSPDASKLKTFGFMLKRMAT